MDERRPNRVLRAVRGVAPTPRYKSLLPVEHRGPSHWRRQGVLPAPWNWETEGVENQPNVAQLRNSRLRSRLSRITFAVPFGRPLDCPTFNNPDRSTQCSSCHIAVFRMRSSMFLSQESRSSKSTCSVRMVSDQRSLPCDV